MRLALVAPLALAALSGLAGCGGPPDPIKVEDAYVRLPAIPGSPAAAYFRIEGGDVEDRLIAIQSEMVPRIELHASSNEAGTMSMKPISAVAVPADGEVTFAPGGNHAMLFDVPGAVTAGTQVPLTFRFQSGAMAGVAARAIAAGDKAP